MRYLMIVLLVLPLEGCWFFMFPIPTSAIQEGNACADDKVYLGQTLRMPGGQSGKVEKVIGRNTDRCREAHMPVLVDVSYGVKASD